MRAPLIFAGVLAVLTAGCETFQPRICDRTEEGNPPVRYTGGTTTDGVYLSSPWNGELLSFPKGMHYDLVHGLGAEPRWIDSYLSFDRYGTAGGGGNDGGTLAQASGNQVVIKQVDDTIIRIANDSCADYWLLVAAGSGGTPVTPP
ncbi:MAG: hypothetical protein QM820_55885 [Minicystis sp.]